jgi:hypothetical protein
MALPSEKHAICEHLAEGTPAQKHASRTVGISGEPTLADGVMVTGQYFSGLGVTRLLRRGITDADENPGAPRAVVISYVYWTRRFARDPSIIGKSVTLNGTPFTIVGVMPRDFYGISVGTEPDLWVPFDDKPNMRPWSRPPGGTDSVFTERDWLCLNTMGRLKDGVAREQAQGALTPYFVNSSPQIGTRPKKPTSRISS